MGGVGGGREELIISSDSSSSGGSDGSGSDNDEYTIDGMHDDYYNSGMFSPTPGCSASKMWDTCWNLLHLQEDCSAPEAVQPEASRPSSAFLRIARSLCGRTVPNPAEGGGKGSPATSARTVFESYEKEFRIMKLFLLYFGFFVGSMTVHNMYYLKDQRAEFMRTVMDQCCNGGCEACSSIRFPLHAHEESLPSVESARYANYSSAKRVRNK
jgi:hypothetical protein